MSVDEADKLRLNAALNYMLTIMHRLDHGGNAVDGVQRAVDEFRSEAGTKSPQGQIREEE